VCTYGAALQDFFCCCVSHTHTHTHIHTHTRTHTHTHTLTHTRTHTHTPARTRAPAHAGIRVIPYSATQFVTFDQCKGVVASYTGTDKPTIVQVFIYLPSPNFLSIFLSIMCSSFATITLSLSLSLALSRALALSLALSLSLSLPLSLDNKFILKKNVFISGVKKIFFMKNFIQKFCVKFRKFYTIFPLVDI
jgi:hypothetical protein